MLNSISSYAFADEDAAVEYLLHICSHSEAYWPAIERRARELIIDLRKNGVGIGVEPFLQEYGLSTQEGVALMCLAESLLRVPDKDTADRLIASSFENADWHAHLGHSTSFAVNASSWGMLLTGKVLNLKETDNIFARLVKRTGEPVIREALKTAMRLMASQFVIGEDIQPAVKRARSFETEGYCLSYDMLGEGARSQEQADRYFASYLSAIQAISTSKPLYEAPGISIKLTALHPRYEWRKRKCLYDELMPRLKKLVLAAKSANICVAIDAEEATRLDLELELFGALYRDPDLEGYEGLGFVLQAYQKRAWHVIDYLIALSTETGRRMPLRLVKGAYWDSEIKAAQITGLPGYPVFTAKAHTDISYLACADKILQHPEAFYPQFATHNAVTIAAIEAMAKHTDYEFQRLFGMGEGLYKPLLGKHRCRIYAPIGEHRDLLAYLIRRLLENGANSSFIHLLWDESQPVDSVIRNPWAQARAKKMPPLPLPAALYSDRKNSVGLDMGNRYQVTALESELSHTHRASVYPDTTYETLDAYLVKAKQAFPAWQMTHAEERALILDNAADLLQERMPDAIQRIVSEGHRTIPDAIAEVREAIDFCRYYAAQARRLFMPHVLEGPTGEKNSLQLYGRGTFACISPWNFPLAIFIGQIAAALAAGNCVIAKPAEQTSAIGQWTVDLLHEAGVPVDVLHIVFGNGETVGEALTKDLRIAGVAFTGSVAAAKSIQRVLAERDGPIIPFIAETGGQNCMIVDSSALLEQVVDDIILSAFGSAGQRCSALRVLFVHEEIADALIGLLGGAMNTLEIGNPVELSTDIGPVIDAAARHALLEHIERMKQEAMFLTACKLPQEASGLAFVAPHLFEIHRIDQIGGEVFGPVLHLIRYSPTEIDEVIRSINDTGYGLTFGIHSRIPAFYEGIVSAVQCGNRYVNRGMTGAVVGVQPFGGEGLSGTGPKAGGPYTLLRFATERSTSINTAALGGNIDLLIH